MKVLLLAGLTSAHTIKWANALCEKGVKVYITGLIDFDHKQFKEGIETFSLGMPKSINSKKFGNYSKLIYLKAVPKLKELINNIKPDIVHAHLASSYGLLGALTSFHPYIVSVWGFDVYSFPQKSVLHRKSLKWVFKKADMILSTSKTMALETSKYTKKDIRVTPFGIDLERFKPDGNSSNDSFIIGTVKSLEMWYGIDYLMKAFKILKEKYPEKKLELMLVGGGSMTEYYKSLAIELGIDSVTKFTGLIPYTDVEKYHNMLDVYVAVSTYDDESFGVAILEAEACSKPVVVSSVGGLHEVVKDNETGFIVPPKDEFHTAEALEKIMLNESLRLKMGNTARNFVEENYDLKNNVENMVNIYKDLLKESKKSK